jgi:hypothetical protein
MGWEGGEVKTVSMGSFGTVQTGENGGTTHAVGHSSCHVCYVSVLGVEGRG